MANSAEKLNNDAMPDADFYGQKYSSLQLGGLSPQSTVLSYNRKPYLNKIERKTAQFIIDEVDQSEEAEERKKNRELLQNLDALGLQKDCEELLKRLLQKASTNEALIALIDQIHLESQKCGIEGKLSDILKELDELKDLLKSVEDGTLFRDAFSINSIKEQIGLLESQKAAIDELFSDLKEKGFVFGADIPDGKSKIDKRGLFHRNSDGVTERWNGSIKEAVDTNNKIIADELSKFGIKGINNKKELDAVRKDIRKQFNKGLMNETTFCKINALLDQKAALLKTHGSFVFDPKKLWSHVTFKIDNACDKAINLLGDSPEAQKVFRAYKTIAKGVIRINGFILNAPNRIINRSYKNREKAILRCGKNKKALKANKKLKTVEDKLGRLNKKLRNKKLSSQKAEKIRDKMQRIRVKNANILGNKTSIKQNADLISDKLLKNKQQWNEATKYTWQKRLRKKVTKAVGKGIKKVYNATLKKGLVALNKKVFTPLANKFLSTKLGGWCKKASKAISDFAKNIIRDIIIQKIKDVVKTKTFKIVASVILLPKTILGAIKKCISFFIGAVIVLCLGNLLIIAVMSILVPSKESTGKSPVETIIADLAEYEQNPVKNLKSTKTSFSVDEYAYYPQNWKFDSNRKLLNDYLGYYKYKDVTTGRYAYFIGNYYGEFEQDKVAYTATVQYGTYHPIEIKKTQVWHKEETKWVEEKITYGAERIKIKDFTGKSTKYKEEDGWTLKTKNLYGNDSYMVIYQKTVPAHQEVTKKGYWETKTDIISPYWTYEPKEIVVYGIPGMTELGEFKELENQLTAGSAAFINLKNTLNPNIKINLKYEGTDGKTYTIDEFYKNLFCLFAGFGFNCGFIDDSVMTDEQILAYIDETSVTTEYMKRLINDVFQNATFDVTYETKLNKNKTVTWTYTQDKGITKPGKNYSEYTTQECEAYGYDFYVTIDITLNHCNLLGMMAVDSMTDEIAHNNTFSYLDIYYVTDINSPGYTQWEGWNEELDPYIFATTAQTLNDKKGMTDNEKMAAFWRMYDVYILPSSYY